MATRSVRAVALMGAFAFIAAACSKNGGKSDTAAGTTATPDTTAAATTPAAAPAPALNDTTILGLLDEANAGDSTNGNLASTKGTSASVKEFGRMMMRDHHKLRAAGQALAKKLNITPAPPAGDTLGSSVQKLHDSLSAQAKGAAWDMAYINSEVTIHQAVVSLLQTAQTAASDTSLKAAIGGAIPLVQGHLAKAQDIQSKLSGSTTAAATGAAGTTPSDSGMASPSTKHSKAKKK